MKFRDLEIIDPILKALEEKKYTIPTPIQEESIPVLLQRKDILGSAQTGTGKTAAFAIPMLQNLYIEKLNNKSRRTIKGLVLAPTRELALQIHENFMEYGKNVDIRTCVIYGGVPQKQQVKILKLGVDILIATPGRLLDLIQQKIITLKDVSYLVLDEADRMLDMGFVKDVKKIVAMVKHERQTMFFSATMPNAIVKLSKELLTDPVRIKVTPDEEMVDKIRQSIYYVNKKKKTKLLVSLLKNKDLKSVLVFSRTKHGANRIVEDLEKAHIESRAIHGNKSQGARQKALSLFKTRKIRVLVATDIAARGIDVDELSHVINYDLPDVPETYVHRIGRTGRAGLGGFAISFCSQDQADLLRDIEKHLKTTIPVVLDEDFSVEIDKNYVKPKKQNPQNRSKTKKKKNYSRKRTKNGKIEPKGFSKHDNKNNHRRKR